MCVYILFSDYERINEIRLNYFVASVTFTIQSSEFLV